MRQKCRVFLLAVAAGVMIGVGGTVYLSCENPVAGALFFALGLFTICNYGFGLFTGKAGYLLENPPSFAVDLLVIWLGNLVGTGLMGSLVRYGKPGLAQRALGLWEAKTGQPALTALLLAMACGLLMYVAVDNFKRGKSPLSQYLGIFLCVPVFILCGFEHSIADMYYFFLARGISWVASPSIGTILLYSLGNVLGALFLPLIQMGCGRLDQAGKGRQG